MRLHFGKIPESATFQPEQEAWVSMREPSPWKFQLLAVPIGVVTVIGLSLLWDYADVRVTSLSASAVFFFPVWIMGVVVIHELIHAAVHPGFGLTSQTILGFWPSKLLFYAHYDNVLSRNRFIAIFLAPLIALSLIPLMIALLIGYASFGVVFVSVFNGLLTCGDVLGFLIVWKMVPKGARVRNRGWKTYYKVGELEG